MGISTRKMRKLYQAIPAIVFVILCLLFAVQGFGQEEATTTAAGEPVATTTTTTAEIGGRPDLLQLHIPFNGAWRLDENPLLLEPGDFSDIKNMRYTDTSIEGVSGYSKINTSIVDSTYLKIRNGFHFTKDDPTAESHVLVQAYNTGLTASKLYENTTAIPSAGDFTGSSLHTDASGADGGRFALAPQGTMVYCNDADRPQVWPGDEGKCMSFITSTAVIGDSITNPRDYTERIQNSLSTSDQVATIGGGTAFSMLLHCDGANAGTTFTDTVGTHTPSAQGDANTDTAQFKFGTASGLLDSTGDYITIPDHADWAMSTGEFTIDMWLRLNSRGNGVLRYIDTDDQGESAMGVWGDGTFIYLANGPDGLHTYTVSSAGVLTHVDKDDQGGTAHDVWGDEDFIYLANGDEGLHSYSVDDSGILTYISAYDRGDVARGVWGDGDFIYVAHGTVGLVVCSVDDSGTVAYVDVDDQGGEARGVWGDGDFIYLANGTDGLHTYSVDGAGVLTHIDKDDQGDRAWGVWGDGTFIYLANGEGGLHTYSVDGAGVLTHIDSDDQGGRADAVWGDGDFIYLANDSGGLLTYSVDGSGNLTYIDTDDQGDTAYNIWGDGDFTYLANYSGGLLTYSQEHTVIFEQAADADNFARLYYEYNNALTFSITTAASETVAIRGTWDHVKDTWTHILLERGWQGGANTWVLAVNGSDIATTTDADAWPDMAAALEIGECAVAEYRYFDGWFDEFRVWKGTAAYEDDFTPPSRPHGTASGYGLIGSPWRLDGVYFDIASANITTSTITFEEYTGTAWSSLSVLDGTSSGGISCAQDGWITWPTTETTSEQKFIAGYPWYWYQFHLSAGTADIAQVTVGAPMQNITNVWGGEYSTCAGAKVYEATNTDYWDYTDEVNSDTTDDVMVLDALEATNDYILLGFTERQQGIEVSFVATEENSTANTTLAVYYSDGSAWVAVSSLNDGTSVGSVSFASNGVITWSPPAKSEEFKKIIAGEDMFYYYKLVFDENIDASCDVYFIEGIPVTEDVLPYKFPGYFQNRTLLCNKDGAPNEVLISKENTSYIFNGSDSLAINVGGHTDLIAGAGLLNAHDASIDAAYILCKESETWALVESGDGSPNFVKQQLSQTVGCAAPLSMDTCEIQPGINGIFWLSFDGPVFCDGVNLTPIRGLEPYFDPIDDLFIGYSTIATASGFVDNLKKEYNLVLGDNWLVLDILRQKWFKKEPPTYPECGWRVQDTNGGQYCYLGYDTGYMYRNEYTNAFGGSDIDQAVTLADIALSGIGYESQLDFLKFTCVEKGTNLVTNGTMEADANWSDYGTPVVNERSTTQVYEQSYSRKLQCSGSDGIQSDNFTTVTGVTYEGTVWVYPVDRGEINIFVRRGDDSQNAYGNIEHSGLTVGQWNKITFSYTEGGSGGSGAYIVCNDLLGTYYFDDISIVSSGTVDLYHRGDGDDDWASLRSVPMYQTEKRYIQHTQRPNKEGITHQLKLECSTDDKSKGMEPVSFDLFYKPLRTDTAID